MARDIAQATGEVNVDSRSVRACSGGEVANVRSSAAEAARRSTDDVPSSPVEVSVVRVTFRSGVTLPACLGALRATLLAGTEILVIDTAAEL